MSVKLTSEQIEQAHRQLVHEDDRKPRRRRSTKPINIAKAYSEILEKRIPLAFDVTVGDKTLHLRLPEGYADSETVAVGEVNRYNQALRLVGNREVLPADPTFAIVARAHSALFHRQNPEWRPDVAPTPVEEKPVTVQTPVRTSKAKPRTHIWRGEPITQAQFEHRVRMVGGLDRIPVDSGEVGYDPDEIDIEWGKAGDLDQDLIRLVDKKPEPKKPAKKAVVVQQPEPAAKAKPSLTPKAMKSLLALLEK